MQSRPSIETPKDTVVSYSLKYIKHEKSAELFGCDVVLRNKPEKEETFSLKISPIADI